MPLPLNEVTWYADLEPVIKTWFNTQASMFPSRIGDFYRVLSTPRYEEIFQGVGGVSSDNWEKYSKTGIIPDDNANVGLEKTFRQIVFNKRLRVQRLLVEKGMNNTVQMQTEALVGSAMRKREIDAASTFNNAFSTGDYAGSDGYALCSNSHTFGSYDNYLALALTKANLDTAKLAMYSITNDVGELVGAMPDLLIVPPALEATAKELVLSQLKPDSANNNVNSNYGLNYVVWHYLTDSTAWFLVDSMRMKESLLWLNGEALNIALDIGSSSAEEVVYHARMLYSKGFIDWRWVIGAKP